MKLFIAPIAGYRLFDTQRIQYRCQGDATTTTTRLSATVRVLDVPSENQQEGVKLFTKWMRLSGILGGNTKKFEINLQQSMLGILPSNGIFPSLQERNILERMKLCH